MKYIKLIRVKQWIKNILIFVPMIFANKVNYENILKVILAFFSFSFMSSFIYIINDIRDIESDKNHNTKRNRPLASGEIKKNTAIFVALLMLILSVFINTYVNNSVLNQSLYFLLIYMVMNLFYSFGLKNIAIIDVMILASGFIIRVYFGAVIVDVIVSSWLFLTVLNASLFLGLGKRKKEFIHKNSIRKVLTEYNDVFLDKFQYLTLTLTMVFYSLWTIEQNIKYLILSIPILMIIFMRYCLIIEKNDEGDPTTILYSDKLLLGLCAFYGIVVIMLVLVV